MQQKINRKFNWVSSSDPANHTLLQDFNKSMIGFYSTSDSRDSYQEMLDQTDNDLENPGDSTVAFIDYLEKFDSPIMLEVGCGSGRVYQYLEKRGYKMGYTGIELSGKVIGNNTKRFPEASWMVAGAYDIPAADESIDICFSFYVLEHLVFPEKAINEMMRVVKKGGQLVLIFPDFVASGRFASQRLGFSDAGTAVQKLREGSVLDAFVSFYDSRIRLPQSLNNAQERYGAFPVNVTPKCLYMNGSQMAPDVDAVYVASKAEISAWAKSKGYEVEFPAGVEGYFKEHAFITIKKI